MKIVVIGAGISGCSCAHQLALAGHEVTIVEKGRGVGGRMSTRRMNGARIDHGAQFFTTRDHRLKQLNQRWLKANQVTEWYGKIPGRPDLPSDMRYRGEMGMTGPAKSLTQNSSLALNYFVEKIERRNKWKVVEREGEGRVLEADHLVITIPSVQMLDLFGRSDICLDFDVMNRLHSIRHTQCLAIFCLLYTSPSPRDRQKSRMPSSA